MEETLEAMFTRVCLTSAQIRAGYTVYEDEDFCYLKYRGEVVAQWDSLQASCAEIRNHCEILMKQENQIWTKCFAS